MNYDILAATVFVGVFVLLVAAFFHDTNQQ